MVESNRTDIFEKLHKVVGGQSVPAIVSEKSLKEHQELAKSLRAACKKVNGEIVQMGSIIGCKLGKITLELDSLNSCTVYANDEYFIEPPGDVIEIRAKDNGIQVTIDDLDRVELYCKDNSVTFVFE